MMRTAIALAALLACTVATAAEAVVAGPVPAQEPAPEALKAPVVV